MDAVNVATQSNSVSVVIPAYNEEVHLAQTTQEVLRALDATGHHDAEVLIFDDASTDQTPQIADQLARSDARVRVTHNERNRNLGYNVRTGFRSATKSYVGMIPADGDIEEESLRAIFGAIGESDAVLVYTGNMYLRPRPRQIISRTFTTIMNVLFDLRLHYYNGPNFFRTSLARQVLPQTDSFAYMAQMVVPLVKSGYTYREVPMTLRPSVAGEMSTSAFRFKNIVSVISAVARLFVRVQLLRQRLTPISPPT